eukprot:1139803-Pelagomonas_calceolata.AAC.3
MFQSHTHCPKYHRCARFYFTVLPRMPMRTWSARWCHAWRRETTLWCMQPCWMAKFRARPLLLCTIER